MINNTPGNTSLYNTGAANAGTCMAAATPQWTNLVVAIITILPVQRCRGKDDDFNQILL
jgi:putative exporter of polyketide antibiotics